MVEQMGMNTENTAGSKRRTVIVWVVLVIVIVAVIATVIGLIVHFTRRSSDSDEATTLEPTTERVIDWEREQSKIDCFVEDRWGITPVTQQLCEDRGCQYEDSDLPGVPSCFMGPGSPLGAGYTAMNYENTSSGFSLELEPNTEVLSEHVVSPVPVNFKVQYHGPQILRIKISHRDTERYEVPDRIVPLDLPDDGPGPRDYTVQYTEGPQFHFQVVRRTGGTAVFDTSVGGLVVSDMFLTFSTHLPSSNVYGFGENSHKTFRHDLNHTSWGMFARDQWVGQGVHNHYSVQPFFTVLDDNGRSHGVLILNSNAMDYTFTPLPMLTFRTVGGILDLLFFMGPTPEQVIQQYTQVVGRPYLPPYWSLGFQLCRYGYNSLERLQEAVNRTRDAKIPLDVQYADIDHYDERKVFTIDHDAFGGLPEYFDYLREEGLRTIIILDPCLIINETDYEPYDSFRAIDGNIKWSSREDMPDEDFHETNTTDMLGFVWPKGKVIFPDFFLDETEALWADLIKKHYDEIKFDGLWIDMNEPANYGTNDDRPWNWPEDYTPYWSLKCPAGGLEDPPYRTMASFVYDAEMMADQNRFARLSDKTLCMTAKQGRGAYNHYDVHSLYGQSQVKSTLDGLRARTGERGLVVSRSTFPGGGSKVGHWLGDNFSQWPALKESIVGMLEFNLFGYPYIGADICGFFEDTNAEMCMRWQQLGAFYPYSRNHNQIDSTVDQDPANFDELTTAKSREAMLIRYELLPYLYTLFYKAHTEGSTVVRPVFHEFPHDSNTWDIDEQFLWGSALLISPVLYESQTELNYYLPEGVWYDYYTGQKAHSNPASGGFYNIPIQLNSSIPLHMRGGFVIPTQTAAMTTKLSRQNPFNILVYLNEDEEAHGRMFWDDGVAIGTTEAAMYGLWAFTVEEEEFMMDHRGLQEDDMPNLESVVIHGVPRQPRNVRVNREHYEHYTYESEVITCFLLSDDVSDR